MSSKFSVAAGAPLSPADGRVTAIFKRSFAWAWHAVASRASKLTNRGHIFGSHAAQKAPTQMD